jgi:SAM-dependent MidA family methyltransferase
MKRKRKLIDLDPEVIKTLSFEAIENSTTFKPLAESILTNHANKIKNKRRK